MVSSVNGVGKTAWPRAENQNWVLILHHCAHCWATPLGTGLQQRHAPDPASWRGLPPFLDCFWNLLLLIFIFVLSPCLIPMPAMCCFHYCPVSMFQVRRSEPFLPLFFSVFWPRVMLPSALARDVRE